MTYRLTSHSSDDDDKYRSSEEVAQGKANDPLLLFGKYLVDANVATKETLEEMNGKVMEIVNDATEYAEKAPYAPRNMR